MVKAITWEEKFTKFCLRLTSKIVIYNEHNHFQTKVVKPHDSLKTGIKPSRYFYIALVSEKYCEGHNVGGEIYETLSQIDLQQFLNITNITIFKRNS